MARKLSAPTSRSSPCRRRRRAHRARPDAGVDIACELVERIRDSGAFDGAHLIPVSRYREVARRLEAMR